MKYPNELSERIKGLNRLNCEVFLSYRSTQVEFAYRLFRELKENNNIETWFDKAILHENVGDLYTELIHQGIRNAQVFLFLYSKDAEESQFIINDEVGYANQLGKTILCFPIDNPDFDEMNHQLSSCIRQREWINKDSEAAFCLGIQEELAGELLRQEKAQLTSPNSAPTSIFVDKNLYLIRIQVQKALGYSTTVGNYGLLSNSADGRYGAGELSLEILPLAFTIPIPPAKELILRNHHFFSPKRDDEEGEEKMRINDEIAQLVVDVNPDRSVIKNLLLDFIAENYNNAELFNWLSDRFHQYIPDFVNALSFSPDEFLNIISDITADWFIHENKDLDKGHFNGAMTGVYEVLENAIPNVEKHRTTINLYYSDYFTFKCMERVYHILCSIKDCFADIDRTDVKKYSPFFCSLGLGGFVIANSQQTTSLVWVKRGKAIAASNLWHFSYDETSNIYKDAVRNIDGKISIENRVVTLDPNKYLLRALDEEIGIKPDQLTKNQYGIVEIGLIKCDRLEMELLSYAWFDCPNDRTLPRCFEDLRRGASDAHNEIAKMDFIPLLSGTYRYTGRFLTPESHYLSQYLNEHFAQSFVNNKSLGHISEDIVVGRNVKLGKGCLIEENCSLGDNCVIGENCRIHRNVFIDSNVSIGNRVKIQNNNSIYEGVTLEDGVFVGTNVCFTNDLYPRSIRHSDGEPVTRKDWTLYKTIVKRGASIGAGAVIRCGVTIGEWAMVGCGAVVVDDVPAGATVVGNPAHAIKTKEQLK